MKKTLVIFLTTVLNICGADGGKAKQHAYISAHYLKLFKDTSFAKSLLNKKCTKFHKDLWILSFSYDPQAYCLARREKRQDVWKQDSAFHDRSVRGSRIATSAVIVTTILLPLAYRYCTGYFNTVFTLTTITGIGYLCHGIKETSEADRSPAGQLAAGREMWTGGQVGKCILGMPLNDDECIMLYKTPSSLIFPENIYFTEGPNTLKLPLYCESSVS